MVRSMVKDDNLKKYFKSLGSDKEIIQWVVDNSDLDMQSLWNVFPRSDWMLWFLDTTGYKLQSALWIDLCIDLIKIKLPQNKWFELRGRCTTVCSISVGPYIGHDIIYREYMVVRKYQASIIRRHIPTL